MLNGQSAAGSIKHKGEGIYVLKLQNIIMEIDAMGGARISSFRLGNKEILSTREINQENFGSTLWISPQIWKWPPSSVLDREEYTAQLTNKVVKFTSSPDSISGFTFIKTFSFEESGKAINVRYEIKNTSHKLRSVAPWEVTRVPAGGLTFFPDGLEGGFSKSNLNTEKINGITWFLYKPEMVDNHQKLFSDGSEGWLAHANNGLLFIKQFPDISPDRQAPKEAEIEIYANKDRTYIELENQGVYTSLLPQESLVWNVKWYLVKVPAKIKLNTGNENLTEFVRKIIAYE